MKFSPNSSQEKHRRRMFSLLQAILRCASPDLSLTRQRLRQMMAPASLLQRMYDLKVCILWTELSKSKRRSRMEVRLWRIDKYLSSSSCLQKMHLTREASQKRFLSRLKLKRKRRRLRPKLRLQSLTKVTKTMSSILERRKWSFSNSELDKFSLILRLECSREAWKTSIYMKDSPCHLSCATSS